MVSSIIKIYIYFSNFCLVLNALQRGKYIIDHISKTKNRAKQFICAKNHCQINPDFPCKFGHFWKKNCSRWVAFWRPITQKLKYDFLFDSSYYPSFMQRCGHFWRGDWGGSHILSWKTTKQPTTVRIHSLSTTTWGRLVAGTNRRF